MAVKYSPALFLKYCEGLETASGTKVPANCANCPCGYSVQLPSLGEYLILSRISTAYYFIHFLILLPLLGRYEKTDPLPQSISDPVLDKPGLLDKVKKAASKYEGENVGSFK